MGRKPLFYDLPEEERKIKLEEHEREKKAKMSEYGKRYRAQNRERRKQYEAANVERRKKYYEENRDKFREYSRKHYENNKDEILRRCREKNRSKVMEPKINTKNMVGSIEELEEVRRIAKERGIKGEIRFSNTKKYKYTITLESGVRVHFCSNNSMYFLIHQDDEKKERYHFRFRDHPMYDDPHHHLYYESRILW